MIRNIMTNKCDFRILSLQLYGKEVEVTLVRNSPSYILINSNSIQGRLVARIWGDEFIKGKSRKNVIALRIRKGIREIEIPCMDILEFSEVQ